MAGDVAMRHSPVTNLDPRKPWPAGTSSTSSVPTSANSSTRMRRQSTITAIPIARAQLNRLIAEARAARTIPWDDDDLRLYRKIVPQMVLWLPEEEGRQLCFDFEAEIRRLMAA